MLINDITLSEIAGIIQKNDRFILLCHKHPDGDTLGSALALKKAIESMEGKHADMLCADGITPNCRFLFGGAEYLPAPESLTGRELIIAVDVASLSMLGTLRESYENRIDIKIDHHEMGESYAKHNYTEGKAGSCGEIIFDLIKELGLPLSCAAEPLYTAISSDTGCFKYGNTTAGTMRKAAELIDTGIDNAHINQYLYESRTPAQIRAISATYDNLKFYCGGKLALVLFTNEIKGKYRLTDGDICEVCSLTREVEGVLLGITIKQETDDDKKYKISMRSAPPVEANTLCARLGGGGHLHAAGADIYADSPNEAVEAVMKIALTAF